MRYLSRCKFLASTAAAGMLGAGPSGRPALAMPTTTIRAGTRVIEVNGRPAMVFGLTQPDGSHGLITEAGKSFRVRLQNQLDEATLIHWHGRHAAVAAGRRAQSLADAAQARRRP